MTIAEEIARLIGDDGQNWETADGKSFSVLAEDADAKIIRHEEKELIRYLFPDGSAIVASPGTWDVEGKEPWSWEGNWMMDIIREKIDGFAEIVIFGYRVERFEPLYPLQPGEKWTLSRAGQDRRKFTNCDETRRRLPTGGDAFTDLCRSFFIAKNWVVWSGKKEETCRNLYGHLPRL